MGAYENAVVEEGSKDELRREFLGAREDVARLTQELEAAEAKGREARNDALEEAANVTDCCVMLPEPLDDAYGTQCNAVKAAQWEIRRKIRALKAPAIGSQGTEKGRG